MSNRKEIDKMLYRDISPGKQYNKMFPKSYCKPTFLGRGDTFFTVDKIEKEILKHSASVLELAKTLERNTPKQTGEATYKWQYKHLQYEADGSRQQLKSPGCMWASKSGDCKSFTIMAGSILHALGINFYIRQVRQFLLQPNQFTHVYIAIPNNQDTNDLSDGYSIVDATKDNNTESAYLEAKDLFMKGLPHYGLNGAVEEISQSDVLGLDKVTTVEIREKFNSFIDLLKQCNANPVNMELARSYGNTLLNNNIDFRFGKPLPGAVEQGLIIGQRFFAFSAPGENRHFYSPSVIARQLQSGKTMGLGADGGEPTTSTYDGEFDGEIEQIFGQIQSSGWWDQTIGNILGNNWNLSCWGASNSPSKSRDEVAIDASAYLEASGLLSNLTTENLRKFVQPVHAYIKHREFGMTNPDIADCTRKGNEIGFAGMSEFYNNVINLAKQTLQKYGGSLQWQADIILNDYNFPTASGYHDGRTHPHDGISTLKMPNWKVVAPVPVSLPPVAPPVVGSNPSTGGGVSSGGGIVIALPGGTVTTVPTPTVKPKPSGGFVATKPTTTKPIQSSAGFGVVEALLITGLAYGAYTAYNQSNKSNNKPKK